MYNAMRTAQDERQSKTLANRGVLGRSHCRHCQPEAADSVYASAGPTYLSTILRADDIYIMSNLSKSVYIILIIILKIRC